MNRNHTFRFQFVWNHCLYQDSFTILQRSTSLEKRLRSVSLTINCIMFFFSFFFRSKDVYTMFGSYYRAYLCQKFHMSTNTAYYYLISGIYFLFYLCFSYTKKSVLEYKMCLSNIFYCIVSTNRSLYSVMYNMEIFLYSSVLYWKPVLDSTSAASRPIWVFNTILTRTISFHIVHNTV